MNKQIISRGLYVEGLRKIKIPAIIFAALVFMSQVVMPVVQTALSGGYMQNVVLDVQDIMGPLAIVPSIMTPILTLVAFYAFNKRSSSDFYQALPYTRTCIFCSWSLSVLTVAVGLIVTGGALGYVSRIIFPGRFAVSLAGMGTLLLVYLGTMLFTMGCVLISMSVTGTFIANMVCALLLMFLPRVILVIVRSEILQNTPVLNNAYFLPWMAIDYNVFLPCLALGLLGALGAGDYIFGANGLFDFINAGPIIFTIVLGLVYLVIAWILFRIRKSETATQSASSRMVQHVIRIALTLAVSLLGTYLLIDSRLNVLAIAIYFIALIVFFAYEIITTRKWFNLVKALPTLLIIIILNAGVWGAAQMCSRAIINNELKPEDIRFVQVYNTSSGYMNKKCNDIRIRDNDTVNKVVADALNRDLQLLRDDQYYNREYDRVPTETGTYSTEYLEGRTIAINTGGSTYYRYIRFTESQSNTLFSELSQTEEFRNAYMEIPEAVPDSIILSFADQTDRYQVGPASAPVGDPGFTRNDGLQLLESLRSEVQKIGFKNWYDNMSQGFITQDEFIRLQFTTADASHDIVNIPLTREYTPDTYAKALALISVKQQTTGNISMLYKLIDHIQKEEGNDAEVDGYYFEVMIYADDQHGEPQTTILFTSYDAPENRQDILSLIEGTVAYDVGPMPGRTMLVRWEYWGPGFISGSSAASYEYTSYGGDALLAVPADYMDYVNNGE